MKASVRDETLRLIAYGHDPHVACISAGARIEDFEKDPDLKRQLAESFAVGTARLKERLTASALQNNDIRALERLVEQREQQFGTREEATRSKSNLDVLRAELKREVERNAVAYRESLRSELLSELAREGRLVGEPAPRPQPSLRPLATLDEAQPLPSHRALVPEPPPPPPPSRGYRLPKVLGPGSPWAAADGSGAEYPL
jgi:hypothetical protein